MFDFSFRNKLFKIFIMVKSFRCFRFIILGEVFNKSWTSYTGNLDKIDYIKNFNWFETWFARGKIEILEYFLTIFLIIFITYFSFDTKVTYTDKVTYNLDILRLSLILIIFSSIFIYFFKKSSFTNESSCVDFFYDFINFFLYY